MAKPGKGKLARRLLFVLEILILLAVIGGLFLYSKLTQKIDTIEQPVLKESEIVVNDQAPVMTGYKTYALFGIDHRDFNAALDGENTDTMIVASINNDTKDVKLVSLYRDTYLNVGNDIYDKANSAYAAGGPERAITMLNTNLDLDIDDYVTVDFSALTTAVDCVGGLDMPMTYAEMVHTNSYSIEVSKETGQPYTPIELPETPPEEQEEIYGTYHLNGVQVTSYCRIRYTSSMDMGRTERQRRVIQMLVNKAKSAKLTTIFDIMDKVFPLIRTSVTKTELLTMLPTLIGYRVDDTVGFPTSYRFSEVQGSIIVCTDLLSNVEELHKFLYGDTSYVPSQVVRDRSATIDYNISNLEYEAQLKEQETPTPTPEVYVESTYDNNYTDYSYDNSYDNSYDYGNDYLTDGYTDEVQQAYNDEEWG